MKFELKRNVFHLIFVTILAGSVLYLGREDAINFLSIMLLVGIVSSRLIKAGYYLPILSEGIQTFGRKNEEPGAGVITVFLGALVALAFFPVQLVFLGLLVLAFGDSFSTIYGMAFGKRKTINNKTFEGLIAGIAASFAITVLFVPVYIALALSIVGGIIELIAVLDDNIIIPPGISLIAYILLF